MSTVVESGIFHLRCPGLRVTRYLDLQRKSLGGVGEKRGNGTEIAPNEEREWSGAERETESHPSSLHGILSTRRPRVSPPSDPPPRLRWDRD